MKKEIKNIPVKFEEVKPPKKKSNANALNYTKKKVEEIRKDAQRFGSPI